jgi:hypothetical protein
MNNTQNLYAFDLGHKRLDRRAAQIVQAALDHTGESIPAAAGSRAATDATYRFLDNRNVEPSDLDAAHHRYTRALCADTQGPLLVVQDTTPTDFTSPARNHTLGQLAHAKHFGFFVHSALAVTADGLPLGLLHQYVWTRPPEERGKRAKRRQKETADKESQRWLDTEQAVLATLPADREVVTISDREADFYDYFALPRRPGQHVLVRAKFRRRIAGSKELLGVAIRSRPVRGTLTIAVPHKDGQPKRQATLTIRWGTFALLPPSTHLRRKDLPPLPLQAVLFEELHPPPGVKPLCWLLLTTLAVASLEDVARLGRWYTYRWRIERYHFVLKSGCQLEKLQLETATRLRRALALYAIVAARLLHLTYRGRQEPEASCEPVVAPEEWEVLWRHFQPDQALPARPPRLHQVIRWIARLGGFLNRKGDGEPGVKVLWRGLRKLHVLVLGFRLARATVPSVQSSDE